MRYLILFVVFTGISIFGSSQTVFDKTRHDFDEIYSYSDRFVDIYIKNNTGDVAYVLSVKKPAEVVYIQRGAMMLKDSSTVLRFQVNPTKKGRFDYEIPVYTSDRNEPTIIRLKGEMKDLPERGNNSFTSCPNFNQQPGDGNPLDFSLTVLTIDAETKKPLEKSSVTILQNGRPIAKWTTKRDGKYTDQIPLGLTYFYATNADYYPAELGAYVNIKRNFIILELTKKEVIEDESFIAEIPPQENEIEIIDDPVEENESALLDKLKDILEKEEPVVDSVPSFDDIIPPALAELPSDNFDAKYFNPINIVFVIDVSSSMSQADRLELMKYSLFELSDMLRPEDRIALVSYASNAKVILPSIKGSKKEEIKEAVSGMRAQGLTAGGAGIKLGYKQAKRNFIKNGNNHIIIITDGGFNRASGDYEKFILKYLKKGITMSVVGIKNNEKAEKSMREAATLGNGRYVPIYRLSDAQNNLKQEIRITSFKQH